MDYLEKVAFYEDDLIEKIALNATKKRLAWDIPGVLSKSQKKRYAKKGLGPISSKGETILDEAFTYPSSYDYPMNKGNAGMKKFLLNNRLNNKSQNYVPVDKKRSLSEYVQMRGKGAKSRDYDFDGRHRGLKLVNSANKLTLDRLKKVRSGKVILDFKDSSKGAGIRFLSTTPETPENFLHNLFEFESTPEQELKHDVQITIPKFKKPYDAVVQSHEISGEAVEATKKNLMGRPIGFPSFGSHLNPQVLNIENKAISAIGDPKAHKDFKILRSNTGVGKWNSGPTQKAYMDKLYNALGSRKNVSSKDVARGLDMLTDVYQKESKKHQDINREFNNQKRYMSADFWSPKDLEKMTPGQRWFLK